MSLIPAFEIGVWNAWIFMIWLLVPYFLTPLNIIPKGREEGNSFINEFNKVQKSVFFALQISFLLLIIYSIFVPIKLGTVWFYTGLFIYLVGLILYAMVFWSFATTPPDRLITRGIYRYSRNPMQLSVYMVFIGVGIVTASWIILFFSVVFMIAPLSYLDAEERHLLRLYGNSYREYTGRTRRWIGIPK